MFLESVAGGTTTHVILFFLVAAHIIRLIGTATYLHGIERDDYTNKCYICQLAQPALVPLGIILNSFFPTRSYVIFLLVSLVYMTFIFRTRDENRSDTNGYH